MIGSSLLPALLVAVLLVVLLWFVFGTQRNIRRGNQLLRWLQTGLPVLGRRTTLQWLGSSVARLRIREPHDPFRDAEVLVVLEPRDVSLMWAWARARSRRDFIILRGELIRPPGFELEAGDSRGWTGRQRPRSFDPVAWDAPDWGDDHVSVRGTPSPDTDTARRFWERLGEATGGVWRLSIRQDPPHVEVHVVPPGAESTQADPLFTVFLELARSLVE